MNRTKKDLSQFRYLKREIELAQERLQELESSFDSKAMEITGMPKCSGTADTVGTYVTEIDDIRNRINLNVARCSAELSRLNHYIDSVDDSQMRIVLTLRYINGFSWRQVAASMGGGNTADSARVMVDRFFKNN